MVTNLHWAQPTLLPHNPGHDFPMLGCATRIVELALFVIVFRQVSVRVISACFGAGKHWIGRQCYNLQHDGAGLEDSHLAVFEGSCLLKVLVSLY